MCPTGYTKGVSDYMTDCNFGAIPSNMVMISSLKQTSVANAYKTFLKQAVQWFGPNGQYRQMFQMFGSNQWRQQFDRRNLLFTDTTKSLADVGSKNTYYSWVGKCRTDKYILK